MHDAAIERLRAALLRLEQANDALARKRSTATYHNMIADGASEALAALDRARAEARAILAETKPHG